jgi:hypothetical protein
MSDLRDRLMAELPAHQHLPPDLDELRQHTRYRRQLLAGRIGAVVVVGTTAIALLVSGVFVDRHSGVIVRTGPLNGQLAPVSNDVASNVPIARRYIETLIASVPLPPDARPRHSLPSQLPSDPPESFGPNNTVSDYQLWSTAMTEAQVIVFLKAHPPRSEQARRASDFLPASGGGTFESLAASNPPSGVSQAMLLVTVAAIPGGGSALRIDAQAIWLPLRAVDETVGSSAATVKIQDYGYTPPKTVILTQPEAIAAVASGFDQLHAVPSIDCAGGAPVFGVRHRYVISFLASRSDSPEVTASTGLCDTLGVTVGGKPRPWLQPTQPFLQTLNFLLAGSKFFATLSIPGSIREGTSVTATIEIQNLTGHRASFSGCPSPLFVIIEPEGGPPPVDDFYPACAKPVSLPNGASTFPIGITVPTWRLPKGAAIGAIGVIARYGSCTEGVGPPLACGQHEPAALSPGQYEAMLDNPIGFPIELPPVGTVAISS